MDPSKIAGIRDYATELVTVKEVRKFLGVVGYQRPFIRNFASIATTTRLDQERCMGLSHRNRQRHAGAADTRRVLRVPPRDG